MSSRALLSTPPTGIAEPLFDRLSTTHSPPMPAASPTNSEAGRSLTPELDLVIPALNEEHRIGRTIAAIGEHLQVGGRAVRLIVVDNGSVDSTVVVAEQRWSGLRVDVISCGRRGKGAAVTAGILHSTARYVGFCDADLSTPPSAFDPAIALLDAGWQVVIGSRRCQGATYEVKQSLLRRFGSLAFNKVASPLVGPIRDTQCGFKLFDGGLARTVFQDMQLHGFAFDVELIARLQAQQVAIAELAVAWSNDDASTLSPVRDGYRAFRDLYSVKKALAVNASA